MNSEYQHIALVNDEAGGLGQARVEQMGVGLARVSQERAIEQECHK